MSERTSTHTKRRDYLKLSGLAAVASIAGCTGQDSNGESGNTVEIRMSDGFPEGHYTRQRATNPYKEKMEDRFDDIKFNDFPGGQVGSLTENVDLAINGNVDIGVTVGAYVGDRWPLTLVFELPGIVDSPEVGNKAFHDLMRGILSDSFTDLGLYPIIIMLTNPSRLISVDKKIESLSDFEGMTIRTRGNVTSNLISELGGEPVSIPGPDTYSALERGTVDAAMVNASAVDGYSMYEVINYWNTDMALGSPWLGAIMNLEFWDNTLKEEHRNESDMITEDVMANAGKLTKESEQETFSDIEDNYDVELYEANDDLKKNMDEKLQEMHQMWINEGDSESRQEVYNRATEAIEEYK